MTISLDIQGIPEVLQRLQRLQPALMQAGGEALYEEGQRIMGESVRLVPVDTGLLRSTAHVERPVQAGQTITVELSYGSHGTAPYAYIQETDDNLNHPNGGQSRYLQQPVLQAEAGFPQRIATDMQPALRRVA